jgi:hypothetical protein
LLVDSRWLLLLLLLLLGSHVTACDSDEAEAP